MQKYEIWKKSQIFFPYVKSPSVKFSLFKVIKIILIAVCFPFERNILIGNNWIFVNNTFDKPFQNIP